MDESLEPPRSSSFGTQFNVEPSKPNLLPALSKFHIVSHSFVKINSILNFEHINFQYLIA